MIFSNTGLVAENFYVLGDAHFPAYLFDGPEPVIFEAGVTAAGKLYENEIRAILGERQPKYLFITHVHWDHCGAVSYLKSIFPSLMVAASGKAREILSRNSAQKLMTDLNRYAESIIASTVTVNPSLVLHEEFRPFTIDLTVYDGQVIKFAGNNTIEVIATPGHTRDLMSYYIPEKKVLVTSEAAGCLDSNNKIIPEFLADYDAYMASLKRLSELEAEVLCQGHRLVFTGKDEVAEFLSRSIADTEIFAKKIFRFFSEEDGSIERVVSRVKREDYDTINGVKQPETPYLINLHAQIAHLAGKYKK
ncbi:MAG: MBL fold metallo-hydrolase [Spirochaetota bacterium]